jgi:hypothetical protein
LKNELIIRFFIKVELVFLVIMGSTSGFITFCEQQYSSLTGLPVENPNAIQYFGKSETTGNVNSCCAFSIDTNLTNFHGTLNYILDAQGKKTNFWLGVTLEWIFEDDQDHMHPCVYDHLYKILVRNNPGLFDNPYNVEGEI